MTPEEIERVGQSHRGSGERTHAGSPRELAIIPPLARILHARASRGRGFDPHPAALLQPCAGEGLFH